LNKKKSPWKVGLTIFRIFVAIGFFAFLIYYLGWKEILAVFSTFNLFILPFSILIFFLLLFISSFSFYLLYNSIRKMPFFKVLKIFLISWSFGLFSPGRLGELTQLYYLKKHKFQYGESLSLYIVDRAFTVLTLLIFSLLGFLIYLDISQTYILIFFSALFIAGLSFLFSSLGRTLIKKILGKYAKKFTGFHSTLSNLINNDKKTLFFIFILAILKVIINSFSILIIFWAFNVHLPFFSVLLLVPTVVIISMIPISINGLGIKESAAVYLFSFLTLSGSITLSVYLIAALINYIFAGIILIYFLPKSFGRFKNLPN